MSQPVLFSMIDKAIFDYKLIQPNDRILIGVSGGKDSTALLEYFSQRIKRPNENFMFTAVHVQTEITPPLSEEQKQLFSKWNIDVVTLEIPVLARLKESHKMNCWWCSTRRRTELKDYALANGYNKLALGHHLDDVLETLLMNMLRKGVLSTMPPLMQYEKFPLTVIRPLYYAGENVIKQHCEERGYLTTTCTCTYQENSGRKEARKKVEFLTESNLETKQRMLDSLRHIQKQYLP